MRPKLRFLSDELIERIISEARDLLCSLGVAVHNDKAVKLLTDNGAKFDKTKDRVWAHGYALQFLNRVMFLYFIQRKGWLGEDTEFLRSFWEAYNKDMQPKDTFFERWLLVLFFEGMKVIVHIPNNQSFCFYT